VRKLTASIHVDKLVRSKRKTIALVVTRDGQLIVRAPLRMSLETIESFINQKSAWIREKQSQAQAYSHHAIPHSFTTGESFLFLGRAYPLVVSPRTRPALSLESAPGGAHPPIPIDARHDLPLPGNFLLTHGNGAPLPAGHPVLSFILSASVQPNARAEFVRWYRAQALVVLRERIDYWSAQTGLVASGLRITSARTRWGSCSGVGVLSFPWRLVMAPLQAIDYVVVHELVHITEKNHARPFWQGVARILPAYTTQVAWLKEHGNLLVLE
jgi:predicted metal-dependent hydrolase